MALLQQGGQITNLTSQQAANQAAQNFPGPNQPFDPRYGAMPPVGGYMPNTAQFPGGYPGYQPMGGGMALFPVANQLQGTVVYAKVVNGEPIILDPETGEVLPPGYVPEIDNPNTHEGWRPGDSWTETMEKAIAQWNEDVRQATENTLRPAEQKVADSASNLLGEAGKQLTNTGNKVGETLHRIAPGEGTYEAPANAMETAQERAEVMNQPLPQQPNMNRPIGQPMMQQSGGQPIMSR